MARSSNVKTEKMTITDSPKRRIRGIQSELKFVAAANVVFWEHGFSNSTITQIVNESGLSVGSFYHQFSDKYDLLKIAIDDLLIDFNKNLETVDLSYKKNGDLFTMWYRLIMTGQKLVVNYRGIYRAITEISKNDVRGFGSLIHIGPVTAQKIYSELAAYPEIKASTLNMTMVEHAVQIMSVSILQSSLGLAPLFPSKSSEFARLIARAACGAMGQSVDYAAIPKKK